MYNMCTHPSMSCIHLQKLPQETELGRGRPRPKLRVPSSEPSDTVSEMLLEKYLQYMYMYYMATLSVRTIFLYTHTGGGI